MPVRIHDLLLTLAGRLDDDALGDARQMLASAELDRSLEFLAGCLAAGRVVLTHEQHAELSELFTDMYLDQSVIDRVMVTDRLNIGRHRFAFGAVDSRDPERGVADAVRSVLGVLPDVRSMWCVWRLTPAGPASGPVPHLLVLVGIGPGGFAPATAYRVEDALRRAGIRASVEVLMDGVEPGEYHREAMRNARQIPFDGPGFNRPRVEPAYEAARIAPSRVEASRMSAPPEPPRLEPARVTSVAPEPAHVEPLPRAESLPRAEALPHVEPMPRAELLPRAESLPRGESLPRSESLSRAEALPHVEPMPRAELLPRSESLSRGESSRVESLTPAEPLPRAGSSRIIEPRPQAESTRSESLSRVESARVGPLSRVESARAESLSRVESGRVGPLSRVESARIESLSRTESSRIEPEAEPLRAEPLRPEPRPEPLRAETLRAESLRAEPSRAESRAEVSRMELPRAEPPRMSVVRDLPPAVDAPRIDASEVPLRKEPPFSDADPPAHIDPPTLVSPTAGGLIGPGGLVGGVGADEDLFEAEEPAVVDEESRTDSRPSPGPRRRAADDSPDQPSRPRLAPVAPVPPAGGVDKHSQAFVDDILNTQERNLLKELQDELARREQDPPQNSGSWRIDRSGRHGKPSAGPFDQHNQGPMIINGVPPHDRGQPPTN